MTRSRHPKRAPIGPYDPGILCRECEDRFQEFDDYAARLLIRDRDKAFKRVGGGDIEIFVAENVDYPKLKLFMVSVLWRASVSTQLFYKRVDLGPRLSRAREMIETHDPGEQAEFATVLSRWLPTPGNTLPAKFTATPESKRYGGVRALKFYLGSFVADVCTDSRRLLPRPLSEVAIAPAGPVYALGMPLAGSSDLEAFSTALLTHGRRLARRS